METLIFLEDPAALAALFKMCLQSGFLAVLELLVKRKDNLILILSAGHTFPN
jgi:hypothetical protein